MLIEKGQLPLINPAAGFRAQVTAAHTAVPAEVAPGTNDQFWRPAALQRLLPEIEAATQVGVAPALQQLHRLAQPFGARLVALPALRLAWIALQPLQHWVAGVVLLEQRQAMAALLSAGQAVLDGLIGLLIAAAPAAFSGQLQAPTQRDDPPVRPALAGPMQAFIEPAHRRGEGIGLQAAVAAQQLGESLVAEAIAAHPAIAERVRFEPGQGVITICGFGGKSAEVTVRVAASADIEHQHQITLLGVPAGVGVHNGGSDAGPIGLAHQQGWKRARAAGTPKQAAEFNPVPQRQGYGGADHGNQRTSGQYMPTT